MANTKKYLVAYFSCSGVTEAAARALAGAAGAELYQIRPQTPYTAADLNWMDKQSRSSREMNDPAFRPAVAGPLPDMQGYDALFVGFPIWWYRAPTIVNTFLEGCKLAGKAVVPFATSGGSGLGRTEEGLRPSCPGAVFKPGRMLNGPLNAGELAAWVKGLGL